MKAQISIIGCGWLGFPLAKTLQVNGYKIKGSTTSKSKLKALKDAAIEGFLITLTETGIEGDYENFLSGSETVIINIPPGLRKKPNKNHVAELTHLINAIEKQNIPNVIYISSTSVFKDEDHFPTITSSTIPNNTSSSAKQIIEIETLLRIHKNLNTTIIRFSGLFDEHRHPGNYLSGKKGLKNGDAPVNLIHKDDCISIIYEAINKELQNMVLNASNPKHPTKKSYYTKYCQQNSLPLPDFDTTTKAKGKIIDSTELVQLLKFSFKIGL